MHIITVFYTSQSTEIETCKMMRFLYPKFLITFLTLAIAGCANIDKQFETIKPTAQLLETRLTNINFEQVELAFDVAINNPNPFSLRVSGLDYEIIIADYALLSGVLAQGLKLKKASTSEVTLPITLKFDDLRKLPGKLWQDDYFSYRLASRIHLDLPLIGKYDMPLTKKGELPVPKIPSVNLTSVTVTSLNLASADIIAMLEINNPNAFQLGLKNFNYKLNINKQTWGEGISTVPRNIAEKSTGTVSIPMKLNLLTMGNSVYQLLNGDQRLNYQLSGNMTLDTGLNTFRAYRMPLNISGSTSLK